MLDLIARDGDAPGQAVVVAVGYNDPEDEYAGEIEEVVDRPRGRRASSGSSG